jgi:hypothetical protein
LRPNTQYKRGEFEVGSSCFGLIGLEELNRAIAAAADYFTVIVMLVTDNPNTGNYVDVGQLEYQMVTFDNSRKHGVAGHFGNDSTWAARTKENLEFGRFLGRELISGG